MLGKIGRPDGQHADVIDTTNCILLEVLREMAHCEYPPCISPRVAGELIQLNHVVVSRRTQHRDWALDLPPNADRQMRDCRRAALRNIDNNYRRNVCQRADPKAATEGQAKLADGITLEPPGEDEIAPDEPRWPRLRGSFGAKSGKQGWPLGPSQFSDTKTSARHGQRCRIHGETARIFPRGGLRLRNNSPLGLRRGYQ